MPGLTHPMTNLVQPNPAAMADLACPQRQFPMNRGSRLQRRRQPPVAPPPSTLAFTAAVPSHPAGHTSPSCTLAAGKKQAGPQCAAEERRGHRELREVIQGETAEDVSGRVRFFKCCRVGRVRDASWARRDRCRSSQSTGVTQGIRRRRGGWSTATKAIPG
eukprot:gene14395-biopygen6579